LGSAQKTHLLQNFSIGLFGDHEDETQGLQKEIVVLNAVQKISGL
jgi:hypothetical protein